ncbi:MAG: MBL fold metallo-hydrolase [Pyrobaculum sp.]
MNIFYSRGVYVKGRKVRFAVDPTGAVDDVDFVLITHGHSDHVSRHVLRHLVVATRETFSAISVKYGGLPPRRITIKPGSVVEVGDVQIAAFDAGHILGSVMYFVEVDGVQILFTGDFNTAGSILTDGAEPIARPDILVMEATYGDPAYVFPNRAEVYDELIDVVERHVKNQRVAIVAYPLGKAQEVTRLFGGLVGAHKSVARYNKAFGISTGNNRDVVIVPNAREVPPGYMKIEVSGWYVDRYLRRRALEEGIYGIPLSDHSDFPNLVGFAVDTSPRLIYTVYGYSEKLARYLRKRGLRAYPIPRESF